MRAVTLVHAAAVVVIAALIFIAMRYPQERLGPWIVVGSGLTSVGLGMLALRAFLNEPGYPGVGHLLLSVGWVVVAVGIAKQSGPYQSYLGPRLLLDLLMITAAWMMTLCSLVLSDHAGGERHLATLVLGSQVAFVTLVALLYADRRVLGMGLLALGLAACVASDAVAASAHLSSVTAPGGWRAGLTMAGLAATVAGLVVIRHDTAPAVTEMEALRLRGLITSLLVGIPLGVVIVLASQGKGINDLTNAAFGFIVVLTYGGRELYRSRQNRRLLRQLSDQALRDPMTGLRNRRALTALMEEISRSRTPVTIVTLDVDRFKDINRQLGHSAGDALLVELGRLLEDQAAGDCFRLGGDEFCVVSRLTQSASVVAAESLRAGAPARFAQVPGVEALAVTISLGLARYQPDAEDSDAMEVLSQSTQALRLAKRERNRVRVYSEADAAREQQRALLEQRLRVALNEDMIDFAYQPIVTMEDGRIISFESLARWTDDVLGGVSPAQFVPVAEETGLIHELGWLALQRATAVITGLRRAGHDVTISVNVSPVQLRRASFDHDVNQLLRDTGCDPSWLTLEVTEGIFMDLDDPAVLTLFRLAAMGICVAIDDFGSGYASFGYMARLPVRAVKVDRSLVQRVDRPKARSVIEALITVAASHKLRVVVEGVETAEEASQLRGLGANIAQGWLWSRGVSEEKIPGLLLPRQNHPEMA